MLKLQATFLIVYSIYSILSLWMQQNAGYLTFLYRQQIMQHMLCVYQSNCVKSANYINKSKMFFQISNLTLFLKTFLTLFHHRQQLLYFLWKRTTLPPKCNQITNGSVPSVFWHTLWQATVY